MKKKKSFFKEVVLFQGDGVSQGLGVLVWIVFLLYFSVIGLLIWLLVSHPDKFEGVMRMWG